METRQQKLEILRESLKQRLARYEQHQHRADGPLDQDFSEQAVQVQNDQVVDTLQAEAQAQLIQVDHALERLHAGLGDVCERCGATISEGRLKALPETTLCADCANWQEG
jgi:DnaK suppressor protein